MCLPFCGRRLGDHDARPALTAGVAEMIRRRGDHRLQTADRRRSSGEPSHHCGSLARTRDQRSTGLTRAYWRRTGQATGWREPWHA